VLKDMIDANECFPRRLGKSLLKLEFWKLDIHEQYIPILNLLFQQRASVLLWQKGASRSDVLENRVELSRNSSDMQKINSRHGISGITPWILIGVFLR